MSKEVQIGFPCPHLVMEEPVSLGSDKRSLLSKAPIAGAGSVRVLVNDDFYVPASGLSVPAVLTGAKPGPYQIRRCQNLTGPDGNLLKIETSAGVATVSLPLGDRVPLDRVQRALRLSGAQELVVVGSSNGALTLTDRSKSGKQSYIRVGDSGASALGFAQTGARGKTLYPGWELVSQTDVYPTNIPGLTLVPARFLRFREPLRGNPTLKMTYAAMPERCPRCSGTYVENDYRFDPTGEVVTIENENLLYQACLKMILTVLGSNPYHRGYGSRITTRIGSKITSSSALLVKQDVVEALNKVQNLQTGQRKYQAVTNRELLYRVEGVDVKPSADDPTVFFVDVRVRNGSNQPVNISTVFSVPGTVALAGTNKQPLGLETTGLTAGQSQRVLLDG